jgi:putative oxidoreductase
MTGRTAADSHIATAGIDASRAGRKANVAVWTLQFVVASVFFLAGLSKMIFRLEIFDEIGWGMWFQYLTGALEMIGAVALVIPRTAGVAALAFVGLAVCAVNFHIFVLESSMIPIALLGLAAAFIAYYRRHSVAALLGDVLGRP